MRYGQRHSPADNAASSWDVVVVGSGPAGMMAAGRAAECGARVLLLERGPAPGRKLLLTASGRCNVSNAAPLPQFLEAFGSGRSFLRKALAVFGTEQLASWLGQHGVETVEEADGRIFPADHKARSVLSALEAYLRAGGVHLITGRRAQSLLVSEGRLRGVCTGTERHEADRVVVATGGLSYPSTGSTGDGYALARQAGHTVVPPYPAITALRTSEEWPGELQGTPARAAGVRARLSSGAMLGCASGDVMWTHYGVSGPAILQVSPAVTRALQDGGEVVLELDLVPAHPEEALVSELRRIAEMGGRQTVAGVLQRWLPRRTAAVLTRVAGLDPAKRTAGCSRQERRAVARALKRVELHVAGPRPVAEAIVTGGGVERREVDPRRMESLLLPGLFFAGEVLDVHGPCGGFNLQAAFATGYLAGESAASR